MSFSRWSGQTIKREEERNVFDFLLDSSRYNWTPDKNQDNKNRKSIDWCILYIMHIIFYVKAQTDILSCHRIQGNFSQIIFQYLNSKAEHLTTRSGSCFFKSTLFLVVNRPSKLFNIKGQRQWWSIPLFVPLNAPKWPFFKAWNRGCNILYYTVEGEKTIKLLFFQA